MRLAIQKRLTDYWKKKLLLRVEDWLLDIYWQGFCEETEQFMKKGAGKYAERAV